MENCLFCKIADGSIHEEKIYEDAFVVAFADKYPVTKGHMLVIPRAHFENIFEVPEAILQKIVSLVKFLAEKSKKELHATGINIMQANGTDANQSIHHLHFHVVPRYPDDNLDLWFHSRKRE